MSVLADDKRTIPVFVVVPPRVLLLDIAGPIEAVRKANLEQTAVRFTVAYVGPRASSETSIGLGLAGIAPLPDRLPSDALILVPGTADLPFDTGAAQMEDGGAAQDAIVRWLAQAVRPGMRLVSICSGAVLAARAGLLDGYDCTTHHGTIAELRAVAPRARVVENRIFVDCGDRLTSAGITAGIDLMLHIVAQEAGHATALAVARHMVIYLRRGGADPQISPWLEGRNHIHPAIHRAQDAVAAEPARRWSVSSLAKIAGASPRNLSRLFNEQTGMSVTEYINCIRVALAHELVTGSRLAIEQVAERSGYASTRQFRRAWNRLHATSPSRLRQNQAGT